jgi:SAM-dependent methyltransferase
VATEEVDDTDLVEQLTQRQPTRRGKHREPRRFDRTQLRSTNDGKFVLRDYAAHFFRWGWITRQIEPGQRLLDVGCGQEVPLSHVLSKRPGDSPSLYVGVDLNKIDKKPGYSWCRVVDQFNFVDDYAKLGEALGGEDESVGQVLGPFDVAVNLEVIEHMSVPDGKKLLAGFHHWLRPDGMLYLSTPVFDGFAAKNHVHEWTIPELKAAVEEAGFIVEKRWGTFANIAALKKVASPAQRAVMEGIGDYYNSDVVSTFLAPLYPDASRNNLWVLRRDRSA